MVILVVDDELRQRKNICELFQDKHEVLTAENGEEALNLLKKTAVDLVITDNQMPRLTGLELIKKGKEVSRSTSFILMTAFGSVEQAVEAIRGGADDYLMKPFDLTEMEHRVRHMDELRSWSLQQSLRRETKEYETRLIGKSGMIKKAKEFIALVSKAHTPVLLLGPTGCGKEVMARAIHENSERRDRNFVAINCASLSENLIESELFGHERGSFTGATAAKPGKFELASNGTLFLDEVGEIPLALQAKLLRVLQEKEFTRLGGSQVIKMSARILAATHRPLLQMVKAGTFREDLYFRLNVISFELLSLSERKEDLPLLIDFFWEQFSHEHGKPPELPPETRALLEAYPYPGNVRELQNVLERLAVLSTEGQRIEPEMLPPELQSGASLGGLRAQHHMISQWKEVGVTDTLELIESHIIKTALELCKYNHIEAAKVLKLDRGTLRYKLKKYQLLSIVKGGRNSDADSEDDAA